MAFALHEIIVHALCRLWDWECERETHWKAGKVELRYEIVGNAKTSAVSCSYHCVRETNSSAQDSSRYICIKANSLVSGFKGQ